MFKWSRVIQRMNMIPSGENGFLRHARVPHKVLYALLFTLIVVIIVLLLPSPLTGNNPAVLPEGSRSISSRYSSGTLYKYNNTYPLTEAYTVNGDKIFKIGLVADQDENSLVNQKTWNSWLKTGTLTLHYDGTVTVKWDTDKTELQTHVSEKGRGAELSELIVFNGKLYTVDDRTGIVFQILSNKLVPWVIMEDGPGSVAKGFKGEWMTVKNQQLYIGGLGKEWTSQEGVYINDHPQYVKVVGINGHIEHRPWASVYERMLAAAGIKPPGYIIHESACWSNIHKKWFFLPRRASKESYNDVLDERRATNLLITADETFSDITVSTMGRLDPYRGFSSFKFVPGTGDTIIVATKSEENRGRIASYMVAFTLDGHPIMKETKIGDVKYEGIEFI